MDTICIVNYSCCTALPLRHPLLSNFKGQWVECWQLKLKNNLIFQSIFVKVIEKNRRGYNMISDQIFFGSKRVWTFESIQIIYRILDHRLFHTPKISINEFSHEIRAIYIIYKVVDRIRDWLPLGSSAGDERVPAI